GYRVGLATDPTGNVLLASSFAGAVNFGSVAQPQAVSPALPGTYQAFLLRLDGNELQTMTGWPRTFPGGATTLAYDVAVDLGGDIVSTGRFEKSISFDGCGQPLGSMGTDDVFVATLAPDGGCVRALGFGGP